MAKISATLNSNGLLLSSSSVVCVPSSTRFRLECRYHATAAVTTDIISR